MVRLRPRSSRGSSLGAVLLVAAALASCGPAVPPPADARSEAFRRPSPSAAAAVSPTPAPSVPPAPGSPTPRPTPASPAPATPPPPTATRGVAARLQSLLDEFRATESAPGIAATVLFPDGTSWTGVSGLADIAGGKPVTPETAFPLASVSKTFLAALILELSAEGAFGLEERVATYLPELRLDPAITIRMLLDHTSGLRDFFEHRLIDRALQDEPSVWWSHTRALGYIDEPYFDPGTGWHYSNTNYLLLGLLAERVTGRSLAVELRDRFLEPHGLESVWYQDVEPARRPLAHGYRLVPVRDGLRPVDLDDGSGVAPFRSVVTAAGGAGSLAGDSRDVAAWAQALYGGEAIDDESLAIMLAGVDAVAGYAPRVPYGLGVQAITISDHRSFGHSGRFLGFRAAMRWLPDDEIAIGVLTNQSRADLSPLVVRMVKTILPEREGCPCPLPR